MDSISKKLSISSESKKEKEAQDSKETLKKVSEALEDPSQKEKLRLAEKSCLLLKIIRKLVIIQINFAF